MENLEKPVQEDQLVTKILQFETSITLMYMFIVPFIFVFRILGDPGVQGDTGSRGFPGLLAA